jgi:hypothetical protein
MAPRVNSVCKPLAGEYQASSSLLPEENARPMTNAGRRSRALVIVCSQPVRLRWPETGTPRSVGSVLALWDRYAQPGCVTRIDYGREHSAVDEGALDPHRDG